MEYVKRCSRSFINTETLTGLSFAASTSNHLTMEAEDALIQEVPAEEAVAETAPTNGNTPIEPDLASGNFIKVSDLVTHRSLDCRSLTPLGYAISIVNGGPLLGLQLACRWLRLMILE